MLLLPDDFCSRRHCHTQSCPRGHLILISGMETFEPIKPWEVFWRSGFSIEHAGHTWTVAVAYFESEDAISLYRDGVLMEKQSTPAEFKLPLDAAIEVDTAWFALKHVRLVRGSETMQLEPTDGSGERWRADMARKYPRTSRIVSTASWLILVLAAVTQLPELFALIGRVAGFTVPFSFNLPAPVNTLLSWLGIAAAIDRALSMKYNPWID